MYKKYMILIVVYILIPACATQRPVVIPLSVEDVSPKDVLKANVEENFETELDRNLWAVFGSNTHEEISKSLILSSSANVKSVGGIISKFYLTQDFDVEVSFTIEEWPRAADTVGLSLNTDFKDKTDEVYITRNHLPDPPQEVYQTGLRIAGKYQPQYEMTDKTSDNKGKLRIKREGGYITAYYSHNDNWVQLKNYPMKLPYPFKVTLYVKNYIPSKSASVGTIKVKFQNLKIKTAREGAQ